MILGSDRRYGDKEAGIQPRSDTIILVRAGPGQGGDRDDVDPARPARRHPGRRRPGQDQLGLRDVRRARRGARRSRSCSRSAARTFPINHVITVDFGGFRRAIDYIGCVYADIDRDYFNDQGGPGGYAVIDIDPGYQKLCGKDALAYVRYRHGDNDLVRAARQQDFLRQVRSAKGTRKLMSGGIALGNLKKLAQRVRALLRPRQVRCDNTKEVFKFAKTVLFTAGNPVREVRFRVVDAPDHVNLLASRVDARGDRRRSSSTRRRRRRRAQQTEPTKAETQASEERAKRTATSRPRSRASRTRAPRARTRRSSAARKVDFPFYFPTLRTSARDVPGPGAAHVHDPRRARQEARRVPARARPRASSASTTASRGIDWRYPPILDDPHETIVRNGRKLMVYRDGKRVRLVAWRTPKGVYWVSNTLTQSLTRAADDRHRRVAAAAQAAELTPRPTLPHEQRLTTREPIGVIGTGYVGLVTAAGFAALGSRRLLRRHRRGEGPRPRGGPHPDLGARPRGADRRAPRAAALLDRPRRRARARAAAVRRGRHAADLLGRRRPLRGARGRRRDAGVRPPRARDEVDRAGRHRREHRARSSPSRARASATCRAPSSSRRARRCATSSSPTAS